MQFTILDGCMVSFEEFMKNAKQSGFDVQKAMEFLEQGDYDVDRASRIMVRFFLLLIFAHMTIL